MSLNNRIYFRERRPPVVGNSTIVFPSSDPDPVCGTELTSSGFAAPEVELHELKGPVGRNISMAS